MKKMILILMVVAIGGFGMTKQEWKDKLFFDASDKTAGCKIEVAKGIIKEDLKNKGFTQNEIINIAIEYSSKYPENKNALNLLDYELRRVSILKDQYFQPYDFKAAGKELKEMEKQMAPGIPSWLKYIGIGLGVLLVGRLAFRYIKK